MFCFNTINKEEEEKRTSACYVLSWIELHVNHILPVKIVRGRELFGAP